MTEPVRVRSWKASPLGTKTVPSLILYFTEEVPNWDYGTWEEAAIKGYQEEARKIVDAMSKHLPQALRYQILAHLLVDQGKQFLYKIPKEEEP